MKHFVKPAESYKRQYDLIGTYIDDTSTYLHLMTHKPLDVCRAYVIKSIGEGGQRELAIPDAMVLIRNKHGDRERHVVRFDRLLADIFAKREILSPSMTAYVHPDNKVSLLAQYIQGNLLKRKTAKHEMFVADQKGDKVLAAIKNATQTTMKIKNNSLSGAQCSPFTVLWNKTAHSTLTSTCRTATSYGNANNEKFLVGNRHYWSPDIVKGNIISIINHTDYPAIASAMERHNLTHPTVEQTMACIERSTTAYWRHERHMEKIRRLVSALTPIQRSAFVFTSDLYHLAQVNPEFVRTFFTEMSIRPTEGFALSEADHWVGRLDDNLTAFVSMLCARQLRGASIQDALIRHLMDGFAFPTEVLDDPSGYFDTHFDGPLEALMGQLRQRKPEQHLKLKKDVRDWWVLRQRMLTNPSHPDVKSWLKKNDDLLPTMEGNEALDYGIVGATIAKIINCLDNYQDLIAAFWVTDNLPSSVYYLPSIMRRSAITSDTDSTIFTVQYWTEWYMGQLDFSETSIAVANTAVYLAGQLIRHVLSTFSANMGVAAKELNRLSMKNEYYFPVFVVTPRAKHYFAYVSAQEGNVFKKMKMEIKGVGLRNSNVAVQLTKASHALMRNLMDTLMAGRKISLTQVLRYVAKKEESIRQSILKGESTYLKTMTIKTRESYKATAKTSNYDHYVMWTEVFAQKYGHAPAPPYRAIKMPMSTDTPVKMRAFMERMEDTTIRMAMDAYMQKLGKKGFKQILVPEVVMDTQGIPVELVADANIRGTISQVMEGFYIILECLGYYIRNDHNTRLVSDEAWLLADDWTHGELDMKE